MNPKIDDAALHAEENTNNLSTGFVTSFLFTTLVALAVIYVWDLARPDRMNFSPRFFLLPWVVAASQEIENGLNEFSGRSLEPVSLSLRSLALGAMLLTTVIGPTLFLFGMRKHVVSPLATRPSWPQSTASSVGRVVTGSIILMMLLSSLIQPLVFSSLKEAQAIQENRDFMIQDLNRIAWDIFRYQVELKNKKEKKDKTIEGYILPPELASTDNARYSVSVTQGKLEILARSMRYPNASITVVVDKKGKMSDWKYEGEFR